MISFTLTIIAIIGLIIIFLINNNDNKIQIAVVEFGEIVPEKTVKDICSVLPIHWYVFDKGLDKKERNIEIEDLREHYKLILEVK